MNRLRIHVLLPDLEARRIMLACGWPSIRQFEQACGERLLPGIERLRILRDQAAAGIAVASLHGFHVSAKPVCFN